MHINKCRDKIQIRFHQNITRRQKNSKNDVPGKQKFNTFVSFKAFISTKPFILDECEGTIFRVKMALTYPQKTSLQKIDAN